jgi:hypothetical protein
MRGRAPSAILPWVLSIPRAGLSSLAPSGDKRPAEPDRQRLRGGSAPRTDRRLPKLRSGGQRLRWTCAGGPRYCAGVWRCHCRGGQARSRSLRGSRQYKAHPVGSLFDRDVFDRDVAPFDPAQRPANVHPGARVHRRLQFRANWALYQAPGLALQTPPSPLWPIGDVVVISVWIWLTQTAGGTAIPLSPRTLAASAFP